MDENLPALSFLSSMNEENSAGAFSATDCLFIGRMGQSTNGFLLHVVHVAFSLATRGRCFCLSPVTKTELWRLSHPTLARQGRISSFSSFSMVFSSHGKVIRGLSPDPPECSFFPTLWQVLTQGMFVLGLMETELPRWFGFGFGF